VCGFFGPIALAPQANQGPLLGIFITGPGGALFGLVAGIVAKARFRSPVTAWKALLATCAVGGAAILMGVLPPPELRARLVEGEVVACTSPAELVPERVAHWEARIADVTWAPPRAGWQEDVARMLRDEPGVVLEVRVARSRDVLEKQKPWNRGELLAKDWKTAADDAPQRYFATYAGDDCAAYAIDAGRRVWLPGNAGTRAWPPDVLANFLGLQVLGHVDGPYLEFAGTEALSRAR
jgi:hypothetical protein